MSLFQYREFERKGPSLNDQTLDDRWQHPVGARGTFGAPCKSLCEFLYRVSPGCRWICITLDSVEMKFERAPYDNKFPRQVTGLENHTIC